MKKIFLALVWFTIIYACKTNNKNAALKPTLITDTVLNDTDDPAIWIHLTDASKSLIIGTDKDENGALFVFDLNGKIIKTISGLKRPNNVDIEYQINYNGKLTDITAVTERLTNKVRIYAIPSFEEIANFDVFENDSARAPTGIALYKKNDTTCYAIVGRKSGPQDQYLWQYKIDLNNMLNTKVVRKFGAFNGGKEIESIAVDKALGFVYYSDEKYGIHKYYADPAKGDSALSVFGMQDFTEDVEGISIYKTGDTSGYIFVSNQQANTFNVYDRVHPEKGIIKSIPLQTIESDGSDCTAVALNKTFPKGVFVAMSNGKVFHYYDMRLLLNYIHQ